MSYRSIRGGLGRLSCPPPPAYCQAPHGMFLQSHNQRNKEKWFSDLKTGSYWPHIACLGCSALVMDLRHRRQFGVFQTSRSSNIVACSENGSTTSSATGIDEKRLLRHFLLQVKQGRSDGHPLCQNGPHSFSYLETDVRTLVTQRDLSSGSSKSDWLIIHRRSSSSDNGRTMLCHTAVQLIFLDAMFRFHKPLPVINSV